MKLLPFKEKFRNHFLKLLRNSKRVLEKREEIDELVLEYKKMLHRYILNFSRELHWLNLQGYDFSDSEREKISEIYIRANKYIYGDDPFIQIKLMEEDLRELTILFFRRTLQVEMKHGLIFSNTEEWENILKLAGFYERESSGEDTTE